MADHEERTWQCGPCGLCIGLAIGFIVAVAPFAWAGFAIYLGYDRLRECPSKEEIPIWSYGFGASLAMMLWLTSQNEAKRRELARTGRQALHRTPMQNMLQLFQLCWTIYGSFLVFTCEDCGNGVQHANVTDVDSGMVGCDATLYQFSYVSLILCWTLAPAIACIICSAIVCCGSPDDLDEGGSASPGAVHVEVPPMYAETDPLIGTEYDTDPPPPLTPPPAPLGPGTVNK